MSSEQESLTPTNSSKLNATLVPAAASEAHSMDDINMLLYMEALHRSAENHNFLSQKVEEAYKKYQRFYNDYANLYSRYVTLVKKANMRKLIRQNQLSNPNFTEAAQNVKYITDKLNVDVITASLHTSDLELFKHQLAQGKKHENLEALREELIKLKTCTETIQSSIESIEAGLENGVTLSLDLCAEELYMTNFPRLSEKNETAN